MNIDDCEKIFEAALGSNTESEFCYAIEPLFSEYEILSLELERGQIYWRARLIDDQQYSNIGDLDYPPAEIARQGRLNDQKIPFFYISVNEETAIAEVEPNNGQKIQIAGFKVLKETPVRVAVLGEYSNVQKNGYMHFVGSDPGNAITRMINELPHHEALKRIYIDRFFAHVLRDPDAKANSYKFSRALTQAILTKVDADGIAFPSVKDHGGFNLGIKADASDRCFENVCCLLTEVKAKRRFGFLDFNIINSAIRLDSDGAFIWPDSYETHTRNIYNMSQEDFENAQRDPTQKMKSWGSITT